MFQQHCIVGALLCTALLVCFVKSFCISTLTGRRQNNSGQHLHLWRNRPGISNTSRVGSLALRRDEGDSTPSRRRGESDSAANSRAGRERGRMPPSRRIAAPASEGRRKGRPLDGPEGDDERRRRGSGWDEDGDDKSKRVGEEEDSGGLFGRDAVLRMSLLAFAGTSFVSDQFRQQGDQDLYVQGQQFKEFTSRTPALPSEPLIEYNGQLGDLVEGIYRLKQTRVELLNMQEYGSEDPVRANDVMATRNTVNSQVFGRRCMQLADIAPTEKQLTAKKACAVAAESLATLARQSRKRDAAGLQKCIALALAAIDRFVDVLLPKSS